MLTLKWIKNRWTHEGENYESHYLVDEISKRCFAVITEPRQGCILYVTDIRVAGTDRSYIDLDAAKAYCEGVAVEDDIECSKKTAESIRSTDAEPIQVGAPCQP